MLDPGLSVYSEPPLVTSLASGLGVPPCMGAVG